MRGVLRRVLRSILLQKSSTTVPRLTTASVQPIKNKQKKDLLVQRNYVQVTQLRLRTKLKYIYQNTKILCTLNNIHNV